MNQESQLARLNDQLIRALKLAMIFGVTLWAENYSELFTGRIALPTLERAIEHCNPSILAAKALDAVGDRPAIAANPDVLLANVQNSFREKQGAGRIVLTRTALTSIYALHGGRKGALRPGDLYLRLIPDLT